MVRRCSAWNDSTALLGEDQVRQKYGRVVRGRVSTTCATEFSSTAFDLTLPAGAYALEGPRPTRGNHKDVAAAPGRNVLTFTVK